MTQNFYVYLLAMWLSGVYATRPVGPRNVHHRNNNFGKCITVNKGGFFHNRKLDYLFPLMRGWRFEWDISTLLLSHSLYTFFDIIEAWHGIACFIMLTSFKITLYSTQRPWGRKFSPLAGVGAPTAVCQTASPSFYSLCNKEGWHRGTFTTGRALAARTCR